MHNGTDCIAFRRSVAGGTGLAKSLFAKPHYIDRRNDDPEQFVAIGWVGDRLYSVIFEFREEAGGEILHLVTLWRSTAEEIKIYEENA